MSPPPPSCLFQLTTINYSVYYSQNNYHHHYHHYHHYHRYHDHYPLPTTTTIST